MGQKEKPSIFGQVEANRLKGKEKRNSIAAAEPAIRASRIIIEKLFQGRVVNNPTYETYSHLSLKVNPDTKESFRVEITRDNHSQGETPEYSIEVDTIDRVLTLHSDYGFIRKSGLNEDGTKKEGKPLKFGEANRYLHFLEIIEAGVALNGVRIENPLIQTPEPVEQLPY